MNKEALTPYQAQIKRICFVQKAVEQNALEKIKTSRKNQDIAIVSILNNEISDRRTAEIFKNSFGKSLTRARISQIRKSFLTHLWEESNDELQGEYPLNELFIKKPYPLSPKDAPSSRDLKRNKLKTPTIYIAFKENVEKESDYKKLKILLESTSNAQLLDFLQRHSKDNDSVLINLKKILQEIGFHSNKLKLFTEKLKTNAPEIPFREITRPSSTKYPSVYKVFFRKHKNVIINALKDDPELQILKINPVRTICGNPDRLPTTTDFAKININNSQYLSGIKNLIKETTGKIAGAKSHRTIESVLTECPIPVFKTKNNYIWRKEDNEMLKAYLKSQAEKI